MAQPPFAQTHNTLGWQETALRGVASGLLAALPVVIGESLMVHALASESLESAWDAALVVVSLAGLLGPLLGAMGAVLATGLWAAQRWPGRWLRLGWWLMRGTLLGVVGFGLVLCVMWLFPAFGESQEARQLVLLGLWASCWAAIMAWSHPKHPALHAARPLRRRRWWLSRTAVVVLLGMVWSMSLVVLGWAQAPAARVAVLERAALGGSVGGWLLNAFDSDGDGFSGLMGGGDCDDGDAQIHPEGIEKAGNGIDEDCDGQDAPSKEVFAVASQQMQRSVGRAAARASKAAKDTTEGDKPDPERTAAPPILLVTIDTLRPDVLGAYGANPSPSPRLDALAAQSVVFDRAYAQSAKTKASISSMMTGQYFQHIPRSVERRTKIFDENVMLAERMVQAGYSTAAVTSHIYLTPEFGYGQGFGNFECVAKRGVRWTADVAVDRTLERIEGLSKGEAPWFVWLHILDPHHPYDMHPKMQEAGPTEALSLGTSKWERYRTEVAWTDGHIGRLIDGLKSQGVWDEVVMVVHSDHGESFGDHGYEYHGQALFDEQIKVVLTVKAPGVKPGRRAKPVMLLDLFATLTSVGEQLPLEEHPGLGDPALGRPISLWPTLVAGERLPSRPVFSERVEEPKKRRYNRKGVIDGPWKLIYMSASQTLRLYNVDRDPRELKDLSAQEPEQAQRLYGILKRFMRR